MSKSKTKFMGYDWDGGVFYTLPSEDVVEAINIAWNFENDVYDARTEELIFSGREDNESNSEMLERFGIRMIDDGGYRVLQSIETNEIYKPDWLK